MLKKIIIILLIYRLNWEYKQQYISYCLNINESFIKFNLDRVSSYIRKFKNLEEISKSVELYIQNRDLTIFFNYKKEIIFSLLIFISFFVCVFYFFIFFLRDFIRPNKNYTSDIIKIKKWNLISFFLIIIFITIFLIFSIFFYLFFITLNIYNCSIKRIPYQINTGIIINEVNFLGFNKYINTINLLKNNFDLLRDENFKIINNINLDNIINNISFNFNEELKQLSKEKIYNPKLRLNKTSNIILNLNNTMLPIQNEINTLKIFGKSMNLTSYILTKHIRTVNDGNFKIFKNSNLLINEIEKEMISYINKLSFDNLNNYIKIIWYLNFGIGLILILFYFSIFLTSFLELKYKFWIKSLKFFLIINSVLTIILIISAYTLLFIYLFVYLFCYQTSKIFVTNENSNNFLIKYYLNFELKYFNKNIENCIINKSNNFKDILKIDNTKDLNLIDNILDGIIRLNNNYKRIITDYNKNKNEEIFLEYLNNYKNQIYYDFDEIPLMLSELNSLKCDKIITFNKNWCPSFNINNCLYLHDNIDISSLSELNCKDINKAKIIFKNLQKYYKEEKIWIDKIIEKTNVIKNIKYIFYDKLFRLKSNFEAINNSLKKILAYTEFFENGFLNSLKCEILNKELEQIERVFCNEFIISLIPLFIILFCASTFSIIINYILFRLYKYYIFILDERHMLKIK